MYQLRTILKDKLASRAQTILQTERADLAFPSAREWKRSATRRSLPLVHNSEQRKVYGYSKDPACPLPARAGPSVRLIKILYEKFFARWDLGNSLKNTTILRLTPSGWDFVGQRKHWRQIKIQVWDLGNSFDTWKILSNIWVILDPLLPQSLSIFVLTLKYTRCDSLVVMWVLIFTNISIVHVRCFLQHKRVTSIIQKWSVCNISSSHFLTFSVEFKTYLGLFEFAEASYEYK